MVVGAMRRPEVSWVGARPAASYLAIAAMLVLLAVLGGGTPAFAQDGPSLGEVSDEVPPPTDTTNPARPPDVEIPIEEEAEKKKGEEPPADLENLSILGKLRAYKRSFVPVPEIIVDPNEGNTFGLLGVWMFVNPKNENLEYMIAPDVRYNKTKGVYPNLRFFGYPRTNFWYSILVGKSTTRDENYELLFENWDIFGSRVFVLGEVVYERDSTRRFYGYGNDTTLIYESNYTDSNFQANFEVGTWLRKHLRISYTPRVRRFAVQAGQVSGVDPILPKFGQNFYAIEPGVKFPFGNQLNCPRGATKFSDCEGAGPQVHWGNRFTISYDSRNDTDLPTEGLLGNVYFEFADRKLGSSTSYLKWGIEGHGYFPFTVWRLRPVLALVAALDYVNAGNDTPFWQRNELGGTRSLRGYGTGRFRDFNRSLMRSELRTTVYDRDIFNTHAEIELAPFLEAGQVFAQLSDSPFDELHPVGGMGFRGVVRPNIVGFVDLGYASEGLKIFTGINYPF